MTKLLLAGYELKSALSAVRATSGDVTRTAVRAHTTGLDPRYSPAVLKEDQPTVYERLGMALAPGLAAALTLHELRGPRCRPCMSCYSMSEAYSPYCPKCRVEHERQALAKAAAR